jgi:hypothetical protein
MKGLSLYVVTITAALAISCSGVKTMDMIEIGKPSDSDIRKGLDTVVSRKLFFGHQSVGLNIIDGLKDIGATAGIAMPPIVKARSGGDISGAGFYHSEVGKNLDPMSKLNDFDSILRGGVGNAVDAAFLKFCYVDFDANTDVEALFSAYRDTMARLKADFPKLIIVHFTAPLMIEERGLKARIKRLIGRKINSDADNAAREAYNRKLRAEYASKAPVFDLALVEASDSNGSATLHVGGDGQYYALRAEYSDDGGHLNAVGRKRAASWLAAELGKSLR